MDTVRIQLLGGFQITTDQGAVAGFHNQRLQSLLTWLILHRATPQARQQLAYLFWPDSSDAQARTNLRNALHLLRNALPDAALFLRVDSASVQWQSAAPAVVDVIEFDNLLAAAQAASDVSARRALLDQAVALYQGDLLPDCYEEWVAPLRAEVRYKYITALAQRVDTLMTLRDYRSALDGAQRLLQSDPLRETTYSQLMEIHAALGDRAAALRVYHACTTTLIDELGVEPSPTTQAIYERILNLDAPTPRSDSPVALSEMHHASPPFIGRDHAWHNLMELWRLVQRGLPKVVMVSGDAGIGKTRLVQELLNWAMRQGYTAAIAHCYAAGGRLAFAPVQEWLRSPAFQTQLTKLEPVWQAEIVRLLPEQSHAVLPVPDTDSISLGDHDPITNMTMRRRLFEAMTRAVIGDTRPRLLVLDDIQWCDAETLDWIEYLLRANSQAPLLFVATLRSGELTDGHPLTPLLVRLSRQESLVEIPLEPLTSAETAQLVALLTGTAPPPLESARVYAETEGNPLFIVEITRARRQNESPPRLVTDNSLGLPSKIQAVIESRLLRLSTDARQIIDVAAAIGRAFPVKVLYTVVGGEEESLIVGLEELWQQQIIREQSVSGPSEEYYDFTHDKLREVVYAALSPMRRRLLHRRISAALESLYADNGDAVSAQIALHHTRAGQFTQAIRWHGIAAQVAARLSAVQEALRHLEQALALLPQVSDEATRAELELNIQMARGPLLLATEGYAAPEVEQAFSRAWALCQPAEDVTQRFRVLWGLGRLYLVRPDLEKGMAVSQQLLALAQSEEEPGLLVEAYTSLGTYLFHRGALEAALDYFNLSLSLYDRSQHGHHGHIFGQDPCIVSLAYGAWTLWCLGRTEEAQAWTARAQALAADLNHPYSQVIAETYASVQQQFMGNATACLHQAERASELAARHGFTLWLSMADFLRGWSMCRLGQSEAGLNLMMESAQLFRSTGAELGACYFAALLAETLSLAGQPDLSMMVMAGAFDMLERTQDRWCAAELHRLQGEMLLRMAGDGKDEAAHREAGIKTLQQALHIAQEQGAGWWVERCGQSLARLGFDSSD